MHMLGTICQVDRFNACFLLTCRMKSFVPSRKAFLIKLDPQHSKSLGEDKLVFTTWLRVYLKCFPLCFSPKIVLTIFHHTLWFHFQRIYVKVFD